MNQKYGIRNIEQVSRYCYYAGLGFGLIALAGGLLIIRLHIPMLQLIPTCLFYEETGYYCPGCGGTRAVMALLRGKLLRSLYYHPFVIYMAVYYVVYESSHIISTITHGRTRGLNFFPPYFYAGIAVILIQWAVKNYLRLKYGFSL